MSDPDPTGYRMPGEFEPHEATWLAWPHDERTWIAGLPEAERAFAHMIEALSTGERVDLLVRPQDRGRAEDRLSTRSLGEVRLHERDHADAWLRDTGPTIVVDEEDRIAIDWRFDAWGGKYEDLKRDDDLAASLAGELGIPRLRVDQVLEGGAIEVDGTGRLLTTRECLVEGRGHDPDAIEAVFERVLGVEETIWLAGGLPGDDTDGHIDTVARFVQPGTVAIPRPEDVDGPSRRLLAANRDHLWDNDLDIVELPHPDPIEIRGEPRPASYANFAIGNEVVLVPAFADPADDEAQAVLDDAFPQRSIEAVPARALIAGYGACHCLTQQIPRAPSGTR
jgi:agmatine deiminase